MSQYSVTKVLVSCLNSPLQSYRPIVLWCGVIRLRALASVHTPRFGSSLALWQRDKHMHASQGSMHEGDSDTRRSGCVQKRSCNEAGTPDPIPNHGPSTSTAPRRASDSEQREGSAAAAAAAATNADGETPILPSQHASHISPNARHEHLESVRKHGDRAATTAAATVTENDCNLGIFPDHAKRQVAISAGRDIVHDPFHRNSASSSAPVCDHRTAQRTEGPCSHTTASADVSVPAGSADAGMHGRNDDHFFFYGASEDPEAADISMPLDSASNLHSCSNELELPSQDTYTCTGAGCQTGVQMQMHAPVPSMCAASDPEAPSNYRNQSCGGNDAPAVERWVSSVANSSVAAASRHAVPAEATGGAACEGGTATAELCDADQHAGHISYIDMATKWTRKVTAGEPAAADVATADVAVHEEEQELQWEDLDKAMLVMMQYVLCAYHDVVHEAPKSDLGVRPALHRHFVQLLCTACIKHRPRRELRCFLQGQ